jgi:hypothetical protein
VWVENSDEFAAAALTGHRNCGLKFAGSSIG